MSKGVRLSALDRIGTEVKKPCPTVRMDEAWSDSGQYVLGDEGVFDPWEAIGCFYGSYSADFDDCAIAVLSEILTGTPTRDDLGARMFRECLCVIGLCEYGSSPRVCFPTPEFGEILPVLIEKWTVFSRVQWR